MAEALRVGELHRPRHVGHRADDLAVDEVPDASHAHQERGGNDQRVRHEQERLGVPAREQRCAQRPAQQQPVRGHAPEPPRGEQVQMLAVEGPLVERDLEGAPPDQHPDRHVQAQAPHLARRQPELPAAPPEKQMQIEEPQGEAEAVPPQVDAADVEQDRIDPVDVRSEHGCLFTVPRAVRDDVNGSAGPGSRVRPAAARRRSPVADRGQPPSRRESGRQGHDAAS